MVTHPNPFTQFALRTFVSDLGATSATTPMLTLPLGEITTVTTTVERSRFITSLCRSDNEGEARNFIDLIRHDYADATHNCSAFLIAQNESSPLERSSDDGEPAGTAGAPMLHALRYSGLMNVTVVVTRYFGGIKLGKGGLVEAYSTAVDQACQAAPKIQRITFVALHITTTPQDVGKLEGYLRNHGVDVHGITWGSTPVIEARITPNKLQWLHNLVAEVSRGGATVKRGDTVLVDSPIN